VLPQDEAGLSAARSREAREAPTTDSICSWEKHGLPARPYE